MTVVWVKDFESAPVPYSPEILLLSVGERIPVFILKEGCWFSMLSQS
jgi:hypothetical protein